MRAIVNREVAEPQQIPVLLKSGERRWLYFGGFMDCRRAQALPAVQRLKVSVFAFVNDAGEWTDIARDEYVVGVLYQERVWVVLDGTTIQRGKLTTPGKP